jgi:transcriptional regulator with XRE-family HTH domain
MVSGSYVLVRIISSTAYYVKDKMHCLTKNAGLATLIIVTITRGYVIMSGKLAEELRKIRGIRDVSLREVERATKISNAYLSQLERGEARSPAPNKLYKLAQFYKVPYESLMKSAGYMKKTKAGTGKLKKPSALQAALMSADLSGEEEKQVAQYIEFLRSQKKK